MIESTTQRARPTEDNHPLPRTTTGRVPGRRGMETRKRLLEEVEKRCVASHYANITVAEIAQAADTSAATFYHYFPDVAAAAAEVAERHLRKFDTVLGLADGIVAAKGDHGACEQFVDAFFDYWKDRPGLIEAVVIASRDEDPRFFRVLIRALFSLTDALAAGVPTGDPKGVAGSLVMMLSQAAARRDGFARDGVPAPQLLASQALIVHRTLSS